MFWHSLYDRRFYLYEENLIGTLRNVDDDSKENQKIENHYLGDISMIKSYLRDKIDEFKSFPPDFFNPSVEIKGRMARVRVTFWNNFAGLIESHHTVWRIGNTVAFEKPTFYNHLKFISPILF